jgi:hydroxyisourate hydrolase
MKQITTHVLDTALGKPAEGIMILLQKPIAEDQWEDIADGVTNPDGRVPNFMKEDQKIAPGIYRMLFKTKAYFEKLSVQGFYPEVPVIFEIRDTEHYHIPLLLSPFGYSTYRGS